MHKYNKIILIMLSCLALQVVPVFAGQEYKGTVKSLDVVSRHINYDAAYEGEFGKSLKLGTLGKPPITKMADDDQVLYGQNLYEYKTEYWQSMVKGYQILTEASKKQAQNQKIQLARYKKLVKPGAVAEVERDQYVNKYVDAINSYLTNQAMIGNKYENVRQAVFRAPFEGVITRISMSTGLATGGELMEYTQLNPIGIDVKMPRSEARQLAGKPVKIYPIGVNKPQGILYGRTVLTDDGVTFVTDNYPESELRNPGYKLRVHRQYGLVCPFDLNKPVSADNLSVTKTAIQKENDKYFVWVADGVKDFQPGKGVSGEYAVKKVYVTPGNLFRQTSGAVVLQYLKDSAGLEPYQVVLAFPPKDLKDGEKVIAAGNRYILMPGEQVKVIVGK